MTMVYTVMNAKGCRQSMIMSCLPWLVNTIRWRRKEPNPPVLTRSRSPYSYETHDLCSEWKRSLKKNVSSSLWSTLILTLSTYSRWLLGPWQVMKPTLSLFLMIWAISKSLIARIQITQWNDRWQLLRPPWCFEPSSERSENWAITSITNVLKTVKHDRAPKTRKTLSSSSFLIRCWWPVNQHEDGRISLRSGILIALRFWPEILSLTTHANAWSLNVSTQSENWKRWSTYQRSSSNQPALHKLLALLCEKTPQMFRRKALIPNRHKSQRYKHLTLLPSKCCLAWVGLVSQSAVMAPRSRSLKTVNRLVSSFLVHYQVCPLGLPQFNRWICINHSRNVMKAYQVLFTNIRTDTSRSTKARHEIR